MCSDQDAEDLSNIRCAIDEAISRVPGVHFAISGISGEKRRRGDGTNYHIDVLVAYSQTEHTKSDFLFNILHDAKLLVKNPSHMKDDEVLFSKLTKTFKDHKAPHMKQVIEQSNAKWLHLAANGAVVGSPTINTLPTTSLRWIVVNKEYYGCEVNRAVNGLLAHGVHITSEGRICY